MNTYPIVFRYDNGKEVVFLNEREHEAAMMRCETGKRHEYWLMTQPQVLPVVACWHCLTVALWERAA